MAHAQAPKIILYVELSLVFLADILFKRVIQRRRESNVQKTIICCLSVSVYKLHGNINVLSEVLSFDEFFFSLTKYSLNILYLILVETSLLKSFSLHSIKKFYTTGFDQSQSNNKY